MSKNTHNATPATVPTSKVLPIYGLPIVKFLRSGFQKYPGARGDISVKMLDIDVPLNGESGLCITTSLYARFNPTVDGHKITFSASQPKPIAFDSDECREEFLQAAELAASRLPNWAELQQKAEDMLLGKTPAKITGEKKPRVVMTRLVGDGKTIATAPVVEQPAAPAT